MSFVVIPALDVAGGRLVRASGSSTGPTDAFGQDPIAAAEYLVASGARRLHLVDVDLALSGRAGNLEILRRIAQLGVPIQASGGITTLRSVQEALDAGADRAVIGSGALAYPARLQSLIEGASEHLIFGLEMQSGRIHPRGSELTDLSVSEAVSLLAGLGALRFLVTELSRVGSLTGPDLECVADVVGSGVPVIAAGGISDIGHLRALEVLGAEGAVVGRAILEATMDLELALAVGT
jgi:phosphoribosylformimino-5-aminoimidazole carboxamide ribotide isomerase